LSISTVPVVPLAHLFSNSTFVTLTKTLFRNHKCEQMFKTNSLDRRLVIKRFRKA